MPIKTLWIWDQPDIIHLIYFIGHLKVQPNLWIFEFYFHYVWKIEGLNFCPLPILRWVLFMSHNQIWATRKFSFYFLKKIWLPPKQVIRHKQDLNRVLINLKGPYNLGSFFCQKSGRWWGRDESYCFVVFSQLIRIGGKFKFLQ